MPILIKNESFNNIFLWKLCFIENNYFLCIVKLKKRRIMKYVIIGGVAGGATAAARLRRVDEMAEILLLEKGPYISYANCGLPYYIGGVIAEREKLLVQTPESFGKRFRIDVRVQNEVIAIHPKNKTVTIRNAEGKEYDESYDKLLLSPGANPVKPPLEGINSEGIFTLRNVEDTDHIKAYISDKQVKRAVVVGAGFIGLEMAENLHHAGVHVSVVEMGNQVMAPIDFSMAAPIHQHLLQKGVSLYLEEGVTHFKRTDNGITVFLKSGKAISADMVLLSIASCHCIGATSRLETGRDGRYLGRRTLGDFRKRHLCRGRCHRISSSADRKALAQLSGKSCQPPGTYRC